MFMHYLRIPPFLLFSSHPSDSLISITDSITNMYLKSVHFFLCPLPLWPSQGYGDFSPAHSCPPGILAFILALCKSISCIVLRHPKIQTQSHSVFAYKPRFLLIDKVISLLPPLESLVSSLSFPPCTLAASAFRQCLNALCSLLHPGLCSGCSLSWSAFILALPVADNFSGFEFHLKWFSRVGPG